MGLFAVTITLLYSYMWIPIRVAFDLFMDESVKQVMYGLDFFVDSVFLFEVISGLIQIHRDDDYVITDVTFDHRRFKYLNKYYRKIFFYAKSFTCSPITGY